VSFCAFARRRVQEESPGEVTVKVLVGRRVQVRSNPVLRSATNLATATESFKSSPNKRGCTSNGRSRVRAGPVRALRMQAEREGRTLKGNEAQESNGSGLVATPGKDNGLVVRAKP
jgi:hypothetical protein